MKAKIVRKHLAIFLLGLLVFTSCEDSENISNESQSINDEELLLITDADELTSDVNAVIDIYFEFDEGVSSKNDSKSEKFNHEAFSCVTKTVVTTDTEKTVTLDFGESCELPNGNILKGKILLNYAKNTDLQTLTITKSYDNFYHNDVQVTGQSTMVKTRENDNGNPQTTHIFNKTLTWPNGEMYQRTGERIREWIVGYTTKNWSDDVYLITGNWQLIKRDGTTISAEVIDALQREVACRFIVSGTISLTKNESGGILDFGDGSCDNVATFTSNEGEVKEVILRKRKH